MEAKTVTCPNCNKTVDISSESFAFCPYCGSKLIIPDESDLSVKPEDESIQKNPVQSYDEYIEEQVQRKKKMIISTLISAAIALLFVVIVANGKYFLSLQNFIGKAIIIVSTPGLFFAFGMTFRFFSGVIIAKKNIEEAEKKKAEAAKQSK